MKLIFLGTAFTVCVFLASCSSQGRRSQVPSITSTPTPTPSPVSSIDIERQKAREIVKRMDKMALEFRERQEKRDEERRENKLCRTEEALADFSPNDDMELSAKCKKRLAELDKGASKSH